MQSKKTSEEDLAPLFSKTDYPDQSSGNYSIVAGDRGQRQLFDSMSSEARRHELAMRLRSHKVQFAQDELKAMNEHTATVFLEFVDWLEEQTEAWKGRKMASHYLKELINSDFIGDYFRRLQGYMALGSEANAVEVMRSFDEDLGRLGRPGLVKRIIHAILPAQ